MSGVERSVLKANIPYVYVPTGGDKRQKALVMYYEPLCAGDAEPGTRRRGRKHPSTEQRFSMQFKPSLDPMRMLEISITTHGVRREVILKSHHLLAIAAILVCILLFTIRYYLRQPVMGGNVMRMGREYAPNSQRVRLSQQHPVMRPRPFYVSMTWESLNIVVPRIRGGIEKFITKDGDEQDDGVYFAKQIDRVISEKEQKYVLRFEKKGHFSVNSQEPFEIMIVPWHADPSRVTTTGLGAAPSGVTDLSASDFNATEDELIGLFIGPDVGTIELGTFNRLAKLSYFVIDPLNTEFSVSDEMLFDYQLTSLIKYPSRRGHNVVTIPFGVQRIKQWSFVNVPTLKQVIVNNTVERIESEAFIDCPSLQTIFLLGTPTIDDGAFIGCHSDKVIVRLREEIQQTINNS